MDAKLYPLGRILAFTLTLHACAFAWAGEPPALPLPDVDLSEQVYPVAITPARLRQPLADVPASITVITAETLRRYGIASIPEALRLVPGMAVMRTVGSAFRINYHGGNGLTQRRMNVMVDGVSVYQPGFSVVPWSMLPVAMEDVDRIEVIRGPDSAAYGPNSLSAVVNILTRHPRDVEPALVSFSAGPQAATGTTVRLGTVIGGMGLRATVEAARDSGMDNYAALGRSGPSRDSAAVRRLNIRAQ